MQIREVNALLDNAYLPLENGWTRLDDGQLHVAARTHMIGATGAMVHWWFSWIKDTEQYLWWHPRDHVWSDWDGERGKGSFIGGTHLVHEYIGGNFVKLKINFRDPALILDTTRFAQAGVTAAVYGRVGPLGEDGWEGHLLHLMQDTPEGAVMRSRFWFGDFEHPTRLAPTREDRLARIPDSFGSGLQQHASEEMSILGNFLPSVYRLYHPRAANGAEGPPAAPAATGTSPEEALSHA